MDAKVIHAIKDQRKPNEKVIAQLKELLGDARKGYVQGIMFATLNAEGQCGTGWSGSVKEDAFRSVGILEYLKVRFTNDNIEEA